MAPAESLRFGQLVYCRGGEVLGRVAAIGARRFLVDTGDIAVWLQRASVSGVEAHAVTLSLAPSEVHESD